MNAIAQTSTAASEIVEILQGLLPPGHGPYQLHEPELSERERELVDEAMTEGFVSYAGRHVGLFEQALARACGTREAVAVVSGTAALQVILHTLGIGNGEEVLCPSLTFVATANAIVHAGAVPHFADSHPDHLGLDSERLRTYLGQIGERRDGVLRNRRTGRRIAAIMPVHVFGHVGRPQELCEVAAEFGLPIIEDATEALGSASASCPVMRMGVAAALSFNGNKIVTTGGGGAIVTDDAALAARLRHVTTTAKRPHPWRFDHDEVGFNYRLPNLNAALGLAQLERLEDFLRRKRRLALAYRDAFARNGRWKFIEEPSGCRSNYWLNAVKAPVADRTLLEEALESLHAAGYKCRPCWTPMHQLAIHAGHPRDALPVAEDLARRIICLPSSARLSEYLQ